MSTLESTPALATTPSAAVPGADIAQLRARIRALESSHESLMRAVAHDLRAPLRHVNSLAPLLKQSVDELAHITAADPNAHAAAFEAQECAALMQHSAQRMTHMLEGMAAVSRAHRARLVCERVNARAAMQSACAALQAQWPQLQLHGLDALADVWLAADPALLAQLLHAVLDNAAKFSAPPLGASAPSAEQTGASAPVQLSAQRINAPVVLPDGAQALDAHSQPCCDTSTHWQLFIRDSGVGFDAQRCPNLGDLFVRAHRESDYAGTGCGLALAHSIAQRHGAVLQLQSQVGAGCTLVLHWPAAQQAVSG